MARATAFIDGGSMLRAVGSLLVCAWLCSCKAPVNPDTLTSSFTDAFERADLTKDWRDTGGGWSIKDGALHGMNAYNHPVWLQKVLPRAVRMELDIWTTSPDGDIKVE